jgi:hypothetical protein
MKEVDQVHKRVATIACITESSVRKIIIGWESTKEVERALTFGILGKNLQCVTHEMDINTFDKDVNRRTTCTYYIHKKSVATILCCQWSLKSPFISRSAAQVCMKPKDVQLQKYGNEDKVGLC